jgi:hypothetical protein
MNPLRFYKYCLFLPLLALLSGCGIGFVKTARFDTISRQPNTGNLEVFNQGDAVPYQYVEIALLTKRGTPSDETDAITGFIKAAKKMGADALILLPEHRHMVGGIVPRELCDFRATAIAIKK